MMPLDTVEKSRSGLNNSGNTREDLERLKKVGVDGITVDVWWGIVENKGPEMYNFAGYMELMQMARKARLKVQAIMSFHKSPCSSNNVNDPNWVEEEMDPEKQGEWKFAYIDQGGRRNEEYVSLGFDELRVLKGRTPVQCYTDFMCAFREKFKDFLGKTIVEIQVGMGPAGELRYPSYAESNGWEFPGIGTFQCFDMYMLDSLKAAAKEKGLSEGYFGAPTGAGGHKDSPEDTVFFRDGGGWSTEYGKFFLPWYSQMLLDHSERMLSGAALVFRQEYGVKISVKVAGIHWLYDTESHAAELTAGYYNTRHRDCHGYLPIARMLGRHGAVLNFTCVELGNQHQRPDARA